MSMGASVVPSVALSLENGALAINRTSEPIASAKLLDAKVAIDVIAQLRQNMETLEDLQGRLSFILKEVSEIMDHRRR